MFIKSLVDNSCHDCSTLFDITLPPQTQLEKDSPPLGFGLACGVLWVGLMSFSPLLCSRDWEWWVKHFYQSVEILVCPPSLFPLKFPQTSSVLLFVLWPLADNFGAGVYCAFVLNSVSHFWGGVLVGLP